MSGQDPTQVYLLPDNGKGKEVDESGAIGALRNEGAHTENVNYTDEPERMFHRRMREAAELHRRAEAEEQAAREAEEHYRLNQGRNIREEQHAPNINLPPPHMHPGYGQQYGPQPPPYQGYAHHPYRHQYREDPSLKELNVPTLENQNWCIDTNAVDEFEVKTGIVHHLPKFAGLPGEVAIQHLKEFEGVCKTLKSYAAPEDRFKLKVFPFSLTDIAKSWFLSLPSGSVHSWDEMQRKFMDKFYPAGKASQIRRELSVIRQGLNESTYDYLERFTGLEHSCCNLGIPEKMLVEYLLDGLRPLERMMLDAAAGGTVMNLSPRPIRELIRDTAESARFREETTRREDTGRTRNVSQVEVSNNQIAEEMKEMREMMRTLVVAQGSGMKACELCDLTSHRTDDCPSLQMNNTVDVNAMGG